jgi:hypothetical protein
MAITVKAVDGYQWNVVDSNITIIRQKRQGITKFNVFKIGAPSDILAICDSKEEAIAWIEKISA